SASRVRRSRPSRSSSPVAAMTRRRLSPSAICSRSTATSRDACGAAHHSHSSRPSPSHVRLPLTRIFTPGLLLPLATLIAEFFPQQAGGVVGHPPQPLLHGLVALGFLQRQFRHLDI